MSEKVLKTILKLNKKTDEELSQANPILRDGEIVLATIPSSLSEEGETILVKVGNGSSTYDELPWLSALAADVFDWAKAESKPVYNASEIVEDNNHKFVTNEQISLWNNKAPNTISTTSNNGLMSASDKLKLDSIEAIDNEEIDALQ